MISRNVMTNMVNPIRIRIELSVMDPDLDHTGNADPDPEELTKLTNKTVLLPFKKALYLLRKCAAKAFCYCPAIISHRPRSQNILKEPELNPEKDSRIKRPGSQVSLEKSSQNYKPFEY